MVMSYMVKRCPNCNNQFPISFDRCAYCHTDLRSIEPSKNEPFDMTPVKIRPKKRPSIPRIKKFKGYEELVVDFSKFPQDCDKKDCDKP